MTSTRHDRSPCEEKDGENYIAYLAMQAAHQPVSLLTRSITFTTVTKVECHNLSDLELTLQFASCLTINAKPVARSVPRRRHCSCRSFELILPFFYNLITEAFAFTAMDGERQTRERLEQENRKVLSHYHKLKANFAETIKELRSDICNNEDITGRLSTVESKLSDMEEGMSSIGNYLCFQLDPKFYNEVSKQDSTIATKLFHIPELAELILSFVDVVDIMAMEQVNKTLRSIINQSPKLQIALCVKGSAEPADRLRNLLRYRSVFARIHLRGFCVDVNDDLSILRSSATRAESCHANEVKDSGALRKKQSSERSP